MADSEQAKAALAELAEQESRRGQRAGERERRRHEQGEAMSDERSQPTGGGSTDSQADYREIIDRAVAATVDLEAAAEFVDEVGLDRLESAVERAEHEVSGLAGEGREALATLERFRVAAEGPVDE